MIINALGTYLKERLFGGANLEWQLNQTRVFIKKKKKKKEKQQNVRQVNFSFAKIYKYNSAGDEFELILCKNQFDQSILRSQEFFFSFWSN